MLLYNVPTDEYINNDHLSHVEYIAGLHRTDT